MKRNWIIEAALATWAVYILSLFINEFPLSPELRLQTMSSAAIGLSGCMLAVGMVQKWWRKRGKR